jgi:hypothetical protein
MAGKRNRTLTILVIGTLLMIGVTSHAAKKTPAPVSAYTSSSVTPYLKYAMDERYCSGFDDAFDRRRCERRWKAFSKRMLKWVKKVRVLDDDLTMTVAQYDFKTRRFNITYDAGVTATSESDIRNGVLVGSGRCAKDTGMTDVEQVFKIKVSPKKAEAHVLRTTTGKQRVTAILSGRVGRVDWCCTAATRRDAKRSKEQCRTPVFLYRILGFQLGEGKTTFSHRFPKSHKALTLDPNQFGVHVPTGSGDFERAKKPLSGDLGGAPILGQPLASGPCNTVNIRRVVSTQTQAMRACYEKRRNQSNIDGKVMVEFSILKGRITSIRTSGSISDKPTKACLAKIFRRMRFENTGSKGCTIRWPIVFRPNR